MLLSALTTACALFATLSTCRLSTREFENLQRRAVTIAGSSENLKNAHYPDWMSKLDSSTIISHITMPGTHDTMTYFIPSSSQALTSLYAQTQEASSTLAIQLTAGMRYLDIRLKNAGTELTCYHGTVPILRTTGEPVTFGDVLTDVKAFLAKYPTETIVMRVKNEAGDSNFGATFANYSAFFDTKYQYVPASLSLPMPTLAEVQGKYFILQDFEYSVPHPIWGYLYANFTSTTEDDYVITSSTALTRKYNEALANMNNASAHRTETLEPLYLSHLSGTTDGSSAAALEWTPIRVAEGNATSSGMNSLILGWMQGWSMGGTVSRNAGIVITDFCGDVLVKTIIEVNGISLDNQTTPTTTTTGTISTVPASTSTNTGTVTTRINSTTIASATLTGTGLPSPTRVANLGSRKLAVGEGAIFVALLVSVVI